jgi:methionyl-tRNA formyltransferase
VRVVFMGTPAFAVPSLRALAAEHDIAAAYTRPDRPAGRGRQVTPSAVKLAAEELAIPVEQPAVFDAEEIAHFASYGADVTVVAAYGTILPNAVLRAPGLGTLNVHASLLPRWRGAAPVQRAILAGDEVTGISIMRIVEQLDAGPYAAQVSVPIDSHTCDSLTRALADAAPAPLLAVLARLADGTVTWVEQDEALATYAHKVTAADVALDPTLTAVEAWRRVRASSRSAPAHALIAGTPVTVVAAAPTDQSVRPSGVLVTKRDLALGFADGALRLLTLTPSARAPIDGAAWARGARLDPASTWGPPA